MNSIALNKEIANLILPWYEKSHREMPWRTNPTPYYVWISEIMLQQTRVEAVRGYFKRFIDAIPDVYTLASCDDDRLNKLWEGLGYYSRARNLKKAAKIIVASCNGVIPSDYDTLLTLPGIGEYTAGAIASFAYNNAYPAIDGNVLRVLTRLTSCEENISDIRVKRAFWGPVMEIIPKNRAADFNQALIELGATLCGPNTESKCHECPLKEICLASKEGKTNIIPNKSSKKERTIEEKTVLVIHAGPYFLIHKRDNTGLLASLFEFPNINGFVLEEGAKNFVDSLGFILEDIQDNHEAKHIFTHKEWHMKGYSISLLWNSADKPFLSEAQKEAGYLFVDKEELLNLYSIPSAFSAYMP